MKRLFRQTFRKEKQFRNGAIAFKKEKCRINLNQTIYIGTSILDLSKVLMQDFYYNYIKNKYGDKTEMLLTDADNLICKIEAENVYEDFFKDKEFSNYPEDSRYYNNTNNLVVSKMKDKTCGVPIKGFVGLKSKMYTFITEDNHESKKAKHVNKSVVDDKLKYEDFKNVLFNRSYMRHEMNRIQDKDHNVG